MPLYILSHFSIRISVSYLKRKKKKKRKEEEEHLSQLPSVAGFWKEEMKLGPPILSLHAVVLLDSMISFVEDFNQKCIKNVSGVTPINRKLIIDLIIF